MSLNTLTDITIPRGPHNYDIRCYDLYVDGSIIGGGTGGASASDFNYALSDPGNGKIDIYGLCKDYNGGVTGQTLLVLGEFNQHLHYSDALNNRIEITDDGSNGVNIIRSGASGTNHIPFKIIQNQNVLDMSDIELYLGKETSTAVGKLSIDNSSILIEDSSIATTQKGLVEVSQLSVRQEVLNSTSVLSQAVLTSGEYKVILPSGTGTSGSCILNLDSTLALPKADITTYASPIGDASSLVLTPEEFSLSSNYSGVNRTISCDQGVYKITNLPPQSAPDVITVNPVSGVIGYGAGSAVTSLSLIGNPVHAFVNNTGALQYRGMISPSNTINYNVTPTNIEMETIQVPMQPTQLGSAYGFQDTGSLINNLGYDNNSTITRGNVIAQVVPTSLSGDRSNVIASVSTLQGTNNIIDSNVIISADTSEVQNVTKSTLIGQSFTNSNDYDHCLYLGDMSHTIPNSHSMCINTDYYGSSIQMAKESAYFGFGQNNLTINNNECHLDFRCPDLFYHDLAQSNTPNILFYDNTNGKITYDALPSITGPTGASGISITGPTGAPGVSITGPTGANSANATLINYQALNTISGNNNIVQIQSSDETSSVSCTPNITQVYSDDLIQINSGSANIEITNLPNTTTPNVIYYDSTSKQISYGAVSNSNGSIDFGITPITVPNSQVETNFQVLTVPANTITAVGDIIKYHCEGSSTWSASTISIPWFRLRIQQGLTQFETMFVAQEYNTGAFGTGSGDWSIDAYFIVNSIAVTDAILSTGVHFEMLNRCGSNNVVFSGWHDTNHDANQLIDPLDISSPIDIYASVATNIFGNCTVTSQWAKCWKQ